ncbi:MAG: hypothetical protein GX606_01885, partial [Elusimicrobia bacterium]|nr:hypothetical protein [Elusimicrobiota bacterium]
MVFRLVREVNIPGATQKKNLESTLYINDHPVALKKGEDINLDVFEDTKLDVMRNGVPGDVVRALGLGRWALGFTTKEGTGGATIDVKQVIEEMERPVSLGGSVSVLHLDTPAAQALVENGTKAPVYRNWVKDRLLKPVNFVWPVVGSFFISLFAGLGLRGKKTNMNALKLSELKRLEKTGRDPRRPGLSRGLAEKWTVFLAANRALVVKAYGEGATKEVAAEKLRELLRGTAGYFSAEEIEELAGMMLSGKISFDALSHDPIKDREALPGFDLIRVTGIGARYETDALPIVALRHAYHHGWITEGELRGLMDKVIGETRWAGEAGDQWTQLFIQAKAFLFHEAVRGEKSLDQTFPDPEVTMYRTLLAKGYDDVAAYVRDENNGENEKQRVERYVSERILVPMALQIRSEIPVLGDSMSELRKKPLEAAVVSEFYRFAMINPSILPDARQRHESVGASGEVDVRFDSQTLDVTYNDRVVMKYSEPATFREKVVYHLILMPLSETGEMSLGPTGGLAPMAMYLVRFLIRGLQRAEREAGHDPLALQAAKEKVLRSFGHHTRFWRAAFTANNWGSIFGGGQAPGLFKRITEPGGRTPDIQPDLRIKELLHDEYMYYFFQRLQAEEAQEGRQGVYEELMDSIMTNSSVLVERLRTAEGILREGQFLETKAAAERDPQKKAFYLAQVSRWRDEVRGLLAKPAGEWSQEERSHALALSSESLYWEIMTIEYKASENKKLERFVHGAFNDLLSPILKKTAQYRLERNPYAYFVNELTRTWKGDSHMWIFRRLVPQFALAPVSWLLNRKFGGMRFKEGEFNETVSAPDLVDQMTQRGVRGLSRRDALRALNGRVRDRKLYRAPDMQNTDPRAEEIRRQLARPGLNRAQVERLNRRLIEANYAKAPVSLEFTREDGKSTYRLQNSLEHYFGIKNRFVRAGIVAARSILTPLAVALAATGAIGAGIFAFSAGWLLGPLVHGKTKYRSEKPLWIGHWSLITSAVSLFSTLVVGKITLMSLMSFGLYASLGLLGLLVPVTALTMYFVVRAVKGHGIYQDRIWSPYWRARTTGWQSWLMLRPIKNVPWIKKNFSGEFYGTLLREIIDVQRTRGPLLSAGYLVQDKLIEDFREFEGTLFSPRESRALIASVEFIARHREGVRPGDPEWEALVAAARAYEEALAENGTAERDARGRSYLEMSDTELVARKRPFVLIAPREPKAVEFLYTTFQTIVLKKPTDDAFARLQGVSTHEHSFNEVVTISLETYGRPGTHNIAGLREYMPEMMRQFRAFLQGQNVPAPSIN